MIPSLYGKNIISISDLSFEEIQQLLLLAEDFKSKKFNTNILSNRIIANCFFEPSTRTRLSFASAANKLGAQVIGFDSADNTSTRKGETLSDSIKVIANYADLIIIRHPLDGAARLASEVSTVPIINAGDGANKHPTQTLLDLFTIKECQHRLENLSIGFFGDLKYARTIHSLCRACSLRDNRLFFVSPKQLTLPNELCNLLVSRGIKYSFHQDINEIINKLDILYISRLQSERLESHEEKNFNYRLTKEMLSDVKTNLKIMHPLPRVDELDHAIDHTPYAYYFEQAANGLYVRQALLTAILVDG